MEKETYDMLKEIVPETTDEQQFTKHWQMKVKKLHPNAEIPVKSHPSDLGWDLFNIEELDIPPLNRKLIRTGIAIQFPENVGGILKDRSGVASKLGLFVKAGVIDPNYRGEIMVLMYNSTNKPVNIGVGARIAQMILIPTFSVYNSILYEVDELDETDRGTAGLGSTGS